MKEEVPMDEDALIDGWDAYVGGRANGLDRLSSPDREVIEMLHTRTSSPMPRTSFAAELRDRLVTPMPRPHQTAMTSAQPLPIATDVRHRATTTHARRWAALGAAVLIAVIASFGSRLVDAPAPPTVQAPLAQATTVGATSPGVSTPRSANDCLTTDAAQSHVTSTFIDADLMPEVGAALLTVRHATLQTIVRREAGPVLPDGYDLAAASGMVADAVVLGAATATFREGAWLMAVDSTRFTGGVRPIFPAETVELLRGDVVVYPIGALVDLSNAQNGRWLEVTRLVLHDVDELPSRVTDSITLNTVARAELDVNRLLREPVEFDITFGYIAGQSSPHVPGAACPPSNATLISGVAQERPIPGAPDEGPTYGGPYVWVAPFALAPPATPSA